MCRTSLVFGRSLYGSRGTHPSRTGVSYSGTDGTYHGVAQYEYGWFLFYIRNDPQVALPYLRRALELCPEGPSFALNLAECQFNCGMTELAARSFTRQFELSCEMGLFGLDAGDDITNAVSELNLALSSTSHDQDSVREVGLLRAIYNRVSLCDDTQHLAEQVACRFGEFVTNSIIEIELPDDITSDHFCRSPLNLEL